LPSFVEPVIHPESPVRRKAGGVIGSTGQEPACAGEYPEGGGGFYGTSATVKEATIFAGKCGGMPIAGKLLTAYQAAGHPAFGRMSGGYRR
jgi:hypothetical protein